MKSPAFQFYPADWLSDAEVSVMTLEEEGAYIRALCFCWREGFIPSDPTRLSRLLKGGSTVVATVVQARFVLRADDPTKMVHPRLEFERKKQEIWAEKSKDGGIKSAEARRKKRLKGGSTTLPRVVQPNGNSSITSSTTSSNVRTYGGEDEELESKIREYIGSHSMLTWDRRTHTKCVELVKAVGWPRAKILIEEGIIAKAAFPIGWALGKAAKEYKKGGRSGQTSERPPTLQKAVISKI